MIKELTDCRMFGWRIPLRRESSLKHEVGIPSSMPAFVVFNETERTTNWKKIGTYWDIKNGVLGEKKYEKQICHHIKIKKSFRTTSIFVYPSFCSLQRSDLNLPFGASLG